MKYSRVTKNNLEKEHICCTISNNKDVQVSSKKEYLDFVLEQLSGLDEVNFRAMMGEYILCFRDRVFGGIYDDRLLVKPVPILYNILVS